MVISEKRHAKLYGAISDPITDLRIVSNSGLSIEEMDDELFKLALKIHKNIIKELNLTKR